MKTKTRRQFTAEFKTKLVLQVLPQEQTLNQIVSANDIHPKQLQTWKQTFLAAAPIVFDQQKGAEKPVTEESGLLYEQIGRLQMELTWLKKNWGLPHKSTTRYAGTYSFTA